MPDHVHMCLRIPPKYSVAHTITLGRYVHVQLVDQTRALTTLPATQAPRANVAALAVTGT
jgi:hypothetical protein